MAARLPGCHHATSEPSGVPHARRIFIQRAMPGLVMQGRRDDTAVRNSKERTKLPRNELVPDCYLRPRETTVGEIFGTRRKAGVTLALSGGLAA